MLNDTHELDFMDPQGPTWRLISTQGKICGRKGHSSVIRNDQIFIFGGDEKTDHSFNDKKILKYLSELFNNQKYSDIQIDVKNNSFQCHKFIVSQSKYLQELIKDVSKIELSLIS
jgi:hypothetical protein